MAVVWKKLAYEDDVIAKSLLTEQGDVIYASAASTPAALAHGDAGQVLQSGGHAANPSWATPKTVATDAIWDAAGDVAVGTGADTAARRNLLAIYAHGNCGADETFDLSAYAQHSGTVDDDTVISITDPGIDSMSIFFLTKDASATERSPTFQKTGGGGTFTWVDNSALSSMTQNAGKYLVWLRRVAADDYWCGYMTVGF